MFHDPLMRVGAGRVLGAGCWVRGACDLVFMGLTSFGLFAFATKHMPFKSGVLISSTRSNFCASCNFFVILLMI